MDLYDKHGKYAYPQAEKHPIFCLSISTLCAGLTHTVESQQKPQRLVYYFFFFAPQPSVRVTRMEMVILSRSALGAVVEQQRRSMARTSCSKPSFSKQCGQVSKMRCNSLRRCGVSSSAVSRSSNTERYTSSQPQWQDSTPVLICAALLVVQSDALFVRYFF